jgi:hypothetical protein
LSKQIIPVWNETLALFVDELHVGGDLCIDIFSDDLLGRERLDGCIINLFQVDELQLTDDWYSLQVSTVPHLPSQQPHHPPIVYLHFLFTIPHKLFSMTERWCHSRSSTLSSASRNSKVCTPLFPDPSLPCPLSSSFLGC